MFHSPASVDPVRETTLLPRVEVIFGDLRARQLDAHQQREECSGESREWHSTKEHQQPKALVARIQAFHRTLGSVQPQCGGSRTTVCTSYLAGNHFDCDDALPRP